MINEILKALGEKIQVPDLALNDNNVLHLSIEDVGELYCEPANQEVLVYLIKDLTEPTPEKLLAALQRCDPRNKSPYPLTFSLSDETHACFLLRIPENAFDLPALEKSLEILNNHHQAIN